MVVGGVEPAAEGDLVGGFEFDVFAWHIDRYCFQKGRLEKSLSVRIDREDEMKYHRQQEAVFTHNGNPSDIHLVGGPAST